MITFKGYQKSNFIQVIKLMNHFIEVKLDVSVLQYTITNKDRPLHNSLEVATWDITPFQTIF